MMRLRLSPVLQVLIATTLIDWLEICPIIKGRVQLTNTDALKGKGRDWTCPLGVAPGMASRMQLAYALNALNALCCVPSAYYRHVVFA